MEILFILAHQDDEIAFVTRIREAVGRGDRVTCLFLTDGAARVPADIRDEESRQVLARLGECRFVVAPAAERIPDGKLPEHLDRALAFVEASVSAVDEVFTLAWEGGHQDHDAAHVIAAVFSQRRGVPCTEMPLYNGLGVRGPLFRVNWPVGDGWSERRVPAREYLGNVLLSRFYPSQRKSWLGLAPLMLLGRPREFTRRVDLRRTAKSPHRRPLLYERRFGYPYERFEQQLRAFLQETGSVAVRS